MSNVLTFELDKTASWRGRTAERHPDDGRNHVARQILTELSAQAADTELEQEYDDLANTVSEDRWGEVHSDVLGAIGFRWEPSHVDDVLREIVRRMRAPTTADLVLAAAGMTAR